MTTSLPRSRRAPEPESAQPPQQDQSTRRPPGAVIAVKKIFAAETANYFLLLGTTMFLVVFGLVMVLSSSSVESLIATSDAFTAFMRQGVFALIGVPLMLIASRMPSRFWKKWAGLAMIIGIALQFLVVATPLGSQRGGNTNWISFGSFQAQPSEVVKVGLVIWLGYILAKRQHELDDWRRVAFPLVFVVGLPIALVLIGGDLGTVIILGSIVLGTLFFAGVRLRYLLIPTAAAALLAVMFAMVNSSRTSRIQAFLSGCANANDYKGNCWQTVHGWWALASGGVFGTGLGNSKLKWLWLPEAGNDFIFAIIGEELGLIGAIVVLALFVVLAIAFVRIIRANTDPFARITVSAVMIWIIAQAFVNIAVVLGLLPVLGVPLPLISSGGSALVTSLFAIGIVLSFARNQAPANADGALDAQAGQRR
jgi:cell division protein FtsW